MAWCAMLSLALSDVYLRANFSQVGDTIWSFYLNRLLVCGSHYSKVWSLLWSFCVHVGMNFGWEGLLLLCVFMIRIEGALPWIAHWITLLVLLNEHLMLFLNSLNRRLYQIYWIIFDSYVCLSTSMQRLSLYRAKYSWDLWHLGCLSFWSWVRSYQ
jgi:hypothetical protein